MVTYNPKTQSFYCDSCLEDVPIRRDVSGNPEELFLMSELVEIDHSECPSYKDVRMAKLARRFRKRAKRIQLLESRRQQQFSSPFRA
jgi:hypothetical protein